MGTELIVSGMFVAAGPAFSLTAAVFGGTTAAWGSFTLGRAILTSQKGHGIHRALFAFGGRHLATALTWALALLVIINVILLGLLAYDGASNVEAWGLLAVSNALGGLLVIRLPSLTSLLVQRSGARPGSHEISAGSAAAPADLEIGLPPIREDAALALKRQRHAEFVQRAMRRYEELRPELEQKHHGECVAISVNTGRYVLTRDDAKLKIFTASLGSDDSLWMMRVGSS